MADHDSAREMADRLLATLGFTSKLFTTDELEAKRQRVLGVGLREMVEGGSPTLVATLKCQLRELRQRVAELEGECETERLRLAGCSGAALGYTKLEDVAEEYRSASLTDVFTLRREVERLRKALEQSDARHNQARIENEQMREVLELYDPDNPAWLARRNEVLRPEEPSDG